MLLIIDNNIESRKNRLQWEESAYLISIKFNENSKSYEGQKFAKNEWKYEKLRKNAVFAWLLLKKWKLMITLRKLKKSA